MWKKFCDDFMQASAFVLFCSGFAAFCTDFFACWRRRFTILMTDDLTAYVMSDIYPHCCSKRSRIVICTSIVVSFTRKPSSLLFRHVATVPHPF
jgi:hypothetical protein